MLYFLTEPESKRSYFKTYHQAIRAEFLKRRIGFREIPLANSFYNQHDLRLLERVKTKPQDIWLLAYAHNPIIQHLAGKPDKKFAHVHGLEASLFEPAILYGYSLNEEKTFGLYDGLFINSHWAYKLIAETYPDLISRVAVSGFPFDASLLNKYSTFAHRMCE